MSYFTVKLRYEIRHDLVSNLIIQVVFIDVLNRLQIINAHSLAYCSSPIESNKFKAPPKCEQLIE